MQVNGQKQFYEYSDAVNNAEIDQKAIGHNSNLNQVGKVEVGFKTYKNENAGKPLPLSNYSIASIY